MKKPYLYILICSSLILLASASVWEGMAAAAPESLFPDTGFYIATNSFPVNSVVEVTNLENGRIIRARVSSSFDNPGLLALLSPDTASAVGLTLKSLARISLSQSSPVDSVNMNPPDALTNSRLGEGRFSSGDPDFDPAAFASLNAYNPYLPGNAMYGADTHSARNERIENGDLIIDLLDNTIPAISNESIIPAITPNYSSLNFIPTETRPPEIIITPDPSMFIPGISLAPLFPTEDNSIVYIDPGYLIEPIRQAPTEINPPDVSLENLYPVIPPIDTPLASENLILPIITFLERGMSYIQIGAYSKIETAVPELKKLEGIYPVVVMNAENEVNPVYRLLIGPVTQGESGALLERFKTNYSDAFIRTGN